MDGGYKHATPNGVKKLEPSVVIIKSPTERSQKNKDFISYYLRSMLGSVIRSKFKETSHKRKKQESETRQREDRRLERAQQDVEIAGLPGRVDDVFHESLKAS